MKKLFLVALVVGVCTPAIMAQETAKGGIYGGLQNLRFNAPGTSEQEVYGAFPNLRFNAPETGDRDVVILPQGPKLTFSSTTPIETGKQYLNNPPFNSRGVAGRAGGPVQCPPSCPGDDYNKFEIYVGYSLLLHELRLFSFISDDIDVFDDFDLTDRLFARFRLHGASVEATYNFSRYVGAQFDFSIHRRDLDDFDIDFIDRDTGSVIFGDIDGAKFRITNYLFGVQFKDNLEDGSPVRPFGHFLVGFSRQKLDFGDAVLTGDFDGDGDIDTIIFDDDIERRRTSFALAVGGGLDLNITDRFSVRAIKFDYLPVFARRDVLFLDIPVATPLDPIFFFADDSDDRKVQHNLRLGAGVVFHF